MKAAVRTSAASCSSAAARTSAITSSGEKTSIAAHAAGRGFSSPATAFAGRRQIRHARAITPCRIVMILDFWRLDIARSPPPSVIAHRSSRSNVRSSSRSVARRSRTPRRRFVKWPAGRRPRCVRGPDRAMELPAVGQALLRPPDVPPAAAMAVDVPARSLPHDRRPTSASGHGWDTIGGPGRSRFRQNTSMSSHFSVPRAGFEPATCGLEVRCSIQLSYRGSREMLRRRPGAR